MGYELQDYLRFALNGREKMYLEMIYLEELYSSELLAYLSHRLELNRHGDYQDNQTQQSCFYSLIETQYNEADIHTNILTE